MICSVTGLQAYGVPLKDLAKLMSKKFSCGANVTEDEKYGECIQIQGDIEEKFMEFAEKELAKYKVPMERIKFEEVKKKKKAEGEAAGDDGEDDA
jgi:translation initiation factor 1 (eIF-1/SUI1)